VNDALLNIKQVSDQLGTSEKTIRNKLSNGTWPVPPVRIGRLLRWRQSDINRIVSGEIVVPARAGEAAS